MIYGLEGRVAGALRLGLAGRARGHGLADVRGLVLAAATIVGR